VLAAEERVCKSIAKVFSIDPEQVNINSSNKTIDAWDSLGQLQVIMALESEFNIRFRTNDIPNLTSVKKLIETMKTLQKA